MTRELTPRERGLPMLRGWRWNADGTDAERIPYGEPGFDPMCDKEWAMTPQRYWKLRDEEQAPPML
jgi:hypothetical protein